MQLNEYQKFNMSYWLQDAIKASAKRDIFDALNDAEQLVAILHTKAITILEEGQ